jgi:hypothetical protein
MKSRIHADKDEFYALFFAFISAYRVSFIYSVLQFIYKTRKLKLQNTADFSFLKRPAYVLPYHLCRIAQRTDFLHFRI